MIYVVGDTHGTIDIDNLSNAKMKRRGVCPLPGEGDHVIIAGDFGLVWADPPSKEERYWLEWLDDKPFETLFVDGNHENFPLLDSFPEEEWGGGMVHRVGRKVRHLMRGEVYDIEGRSVFAFGGAASHDRQFRTEGETWWPEEMPDEADFARAEASLSRCGWEVDLVITHCAPTLVQGMINPAFLPDQATEFLQNLRDRMSFKAWFFGHYHVNRMLPDGFYALYGNVAMVDGESVTVFGSRKDGWRQRLEGKLSWLRNG